jgi:Zn-dependent protease
MQETSPIFYILVLIISVIIHEIAHGYAALHYGDHTAEYQGRLTLNPLKHLDPYGSVILPLLLLLTHAPFLIGWAKPVPYNPDNFNPAKRRIATLWVASAGILSNLAIAIFFSLVIRLAMATSFIPASIIPLASVVVLVNIVLAVFNLVPIPPLDGSKILFSLGGYSMMRIERFFEKYSLIVLLIFIFFLWQFITPVIFFLFSFLTGIGA